MKTAKRTAWRITERFTEAEILTDPQLRITVVHS
jgi:hypothetical protein